MVFHALTFPRSRGRCRRPRFLTLPEGQANVNTLEKHVWSLLLHKTNCDTWKFEIFEENEPINLYFLGIKACRNGTLTACVLEMPLPGQIPTPCWRHVFTFATVHATDANVTFYDGPGMHTVKAAKQVYNSMWIALLKHGFVLVKTWLLIACGTGFYAIFKFKIVFCYSPTKTVVLGFSKMQHNCR